MMLLKMSNNENRNNLKHVYIKIHRQPLGTVVAVCDDYLLGKNLNNGKMNYKISEQFFKGEIMDIEPVLNILKQSNNFNIIGLNKIKI